MTPPTPLTQTSDMRHLWTSELALNSGVGQVLYRLNSGEQAWGTCVTEDECGCEYLWPDKKYVGQTTKSGFVRREKGIRDAI